MRWTSENPRRRVLLHESTEIEAQIEPVFALWNRYETFPGFMASVRRVKRIGEDRLLWDVNLAGRQFIWESRILECIPQKRIRWESTWGAPTAGEVCFEALANSRTRLVVEIRYQPRGFLEHLGARFGLADRRLRHDLERFRTFVEGLAPDEIDNDQKLRRADRRASGSVVGAS